MAFGIANSSNQSFALGGFGACNFTADQIVQNSFQTCATYISALETCPKTPVLQADRLDIANLTSMCFAAVFAYYLAPQYLGPYLETKPPAIEADPSCKYPDFAPILLEACAWDYHQLSLYCKDQPQSNFTNIYSSDITGWTNCRNQAVAQYWRCSQQKAYHEVAQCVIDNSQKINWVSQPIIYEGAPSCPTPYYWIGVQVATVLGALLMRVATVLAIPLFKKLMPKNSGMVGEAEERTGPIQPWNIGPDKNRPKVESGVVMIPRSGIKKEKNIWAKEELYILSASQLVASIAGEVLANILAVLVIRNSGVGAFFNARNVIWDLFILFAIRPRVAPLSGLLGFMQGWSQVALADIVIDGLLAVLAGMKFTVYYFHDAWQSNPNPAAPHASLRILAIGAFMAAIPPLLWWIPAIIYAKKATDTGFCAAIVLSMGVMIRVVICIVCLPLYALWEVCALLYLAVKTIKDINKPHVRMTVWTAGGSAMRQWKQPIRIKATEFRTAYAILVAFSWVINTGNWIFYSIFLILEGDAYCPAGSTAVSAILILVPIAMGLPLQALGWIVDR